VPQIPIHNLRHTYITLALHRLPNRDPEARAGHVDPAFLLRRYAQTLPGRQRDLALSISEMTAVNGSGTAVRAAEEDTQTA
jgi:integrase